MKKLLIILCAMLLSGTIHATAKTAPDKTRFKALVLTETGGQHGPFVEEALKWFKKYGKDNDVEFTVVNDTKKIDENFLSQYKLFIQLNYPPYNWTETSREVFERFIIDGRIGWIGFHHATLLGEFDGFEMWKWFSKWMGNIRFKNYIAPLASGKVVVERSSHPVMKNVDKEFVLDKDEWYTYDVSPRREVSVLAHVDERSYTPASDIKMGDHPVVWTNNKVKARNVYFQFGHAPECFSNKNFTTMFANAIEWAASGAQWFPRFRALVVRNPRVEPAHRQFADDAIKLFDELRIGDGMVFDYTTDQADFNDETLRTYDLVISLDDNPGHSPEQRTAFQKYMENGGAWLGFHAAGYNDRSTNWPWFVEFLGGAVFGRNSWPPLPAKIKTESREMAVMKGLPETYMAPANEWYQWNPSPRKNPDVKVLATLDDANYPIGFKDVLPDGDTPVAWTNTKYKMVYINIGHGPHTFEDATQTYFITNVIRWLVKEKYEDGQ